VKLATNQSDWQSFLATIRDCGVQSTPEQAVGPGRVAGSERALHGRLYVGKIQTVFP
jgi:hypothetical protein